MIKTKLLIQNEDGQTMVEYILLLLVVVSILVGVMRNIEEYLVTNPNSMMNTYLGQFQTVFDGDSNLKYKRFRIPR